MNGGARQTKRSIGDLILLLSGCLVFFIFDTNPGSLSAKKKNLIVPAAVVDALFLPGHVGHLCT